jgi:8-oxo-dGTP pyrophosphatase MutT (NUDIX family)
VHRRQVIELLERYKKAWPAEAEIAQRFLAFVAAHDDCLLRTCVPGHITASAWILSADGGSALLTHHRKLDRWLQLGGHVDGESQIELAALREAQEELGMAHFQFEAWFGAWSGGKIVPLDLDVHTIPARANEPQHEHWDLRFLLRALPGQELVRSPESRDLRWVPLAELPRVTTEESVLRLGRKAQALVRATSRQPGSQQANDQA